MKHLKLMTIVSAGLLALAGCGGGGGSSSPGTVAVSGTAAKGILIDADVSVYALVNGVKGTTPLATTTTNSDGEYVLNLAPTSNPLLIEVKANANTKMLDETGTLTSDGKYPEVAAPSDLALRSYAAEATQTTVVRVNPLTEMAIAVAEEAGGFTLNNLVAGQEVAKLAAPEGVNPFSQEPVAKPVDMNDAQLKFAMQMAGLLAASKTESACALQCQIAKLSEGVEITVASDGKATVPAAINIAIQEKKQAVLSAGQAALKVDEATQSKKTTIAEAVLAAASKAVEDAKTNTGGVTTPDTEAVIAANGLKGFVTALRDGFRLTETRLLNVEEDLTKNYETATLDGLSFVGQVLNALESDCDEQSGALVCASSESSVMNWSGSNNSYTWTTKNNADPLGRTSTGTVTGSTVNGLKTATLNGSIVKDGKTLVTMTNLAIGIEDKGDADFKAAINGKLMANGTSGSSPLAVTLSFNNLMFESVPKSADNVYPQLADVSYKGGLTLESNLGDKLTGSIDVQTREVGTRVFYGNNQNWYMTYDEFIKSGVIDLKATSTGNIANLAALKINLSASRDDYSKPESATNFETYSGTVNLSLTDSLSVLFSESTKAWDTVSQSATIKSGGSEVTLSADYKKDVTSGWCQWGVIQRCASSVSLTSNNANPYKATLTKVNGKTQGNIMLGDVKVGEFVNGVLKINGEEVSLY